MNTGDVIGPYRVVSLLGRGGMGEVFEVEHEKLGVRYALKTFTLDEGQIEFFRERFVAEGKILARLRHPNIARVFDLDIDEKSGSLYFVMDLVRYQDGRSYALSDLAPGGAEEAYIADWFVKLASALDYVHGQGVVHRDIKLENILLSGAGDVVLSDFGISRFVSERIRRELHVERTMVSTSDGRRTPGTVVLGTRGYMAPEVARGEPATIAADTYSLGVAFFRLLTGIWYEPGTDVLKLLEPFDGAWMEILPPMLEQDPAKRPILLSELAEKLSAAFPETPHTLKTLKFYDPTTELTKKRQTERFRGFRWIAGALAAAGLIAAVALLLLRGRTVSEGAPSPEEAVASAPEPANRSFDLGDDIMLEMIGCPAGSFEMSGWPETNGPHRVRLTRPFWLSKVQVTRQLWDRVFCGSSTNLVPVRNTAREHKNGFFARLNEALKADTPKGYVFRLPTEAELEYAMTSGGKDRISSLSVGVLGPSVDDKRAYAASTGSKWRSEMKILPIRVATKRPNTWGFYDIVNNGQTMVLDRVASGIGCRMAADESIAYADEEVDPLAWDEGRDGVSWMSRGDGLFQRVRIGNYDYRATIRVCLGPDLVAERGLAAEGAK